MKAIYDMMGKWTYPVLKEETPRQHVEIFFQVRSLFTTGYLCVKSGVCLKNFLPILLAHAQGN